MGAVRLGNTLVSYMSDLEQTHPPHQYFLPRHMQGTLPPTLALNVGTGLDRDVQNHSMWTSLGTSAH